MRHPIKEYTHFGYDWLEWTGNVYHPGIDYNYGAPWEDLGMGVYPMKAGKVVHVQYQDDPDEEGWGNMVIIKHDDGLYTRYAHLDIVMAKVGDKVTPFTPFAEVGVSGTGSPHLHFEIFDKFIYNQGPTYYPNGKTKSFIKSHYKNPMEHIKPTEVNIKIVANNCKWVDKKIKKVKDWIWKSSGQQLKANISVEHTSMDIQFNDAPPEQREIDERWWKLNVAPRASGFDICVLTMPEDEWDTEDNAGYRNAHKLLGLEMIAMHADENITRSNRAHKDEFIGRILHEISHALYNMSGIKRNGTRDEFIEGADNTHYWDYNRKDLAPAFKEFDYENLQGWDDDLLFYKKYKSGRRKTKPTFEPKAGRFYKTSDDHMYFYFNGIRWELTSQERYENAAANNKKTVIISSGEGNWILEKKIGMDEPPHEFAETIITRKTDKTWKQLGFKMLGWQRRIPRINN